MTSLTAPTLPIRPGLEASSRPLRLELCCAIGLVLAISNALICFTPIAAIDTIEDEEVAYDVSENKAANRQRDFTPTSAIGFLLLGGAGVLSFLLPRQGGELHGPLWWCLLSFLLWNYGSIAWADDQMFTVRKLVIFSLFLSAVIGFTRVLTLREFAITVGGVAFVFIIWGVLAELRIGAFRPWRSDYRFSGTVHPNEQSLFCAIAGLAALFLRSRKAGWSIFLAPIVFASSFFFLVITKSRTGFFAVLAALVLGAILRTDANKRAIVLLCGVMLMAVGMFTLGAAGSGGIRQFEEMATLGRGEHVSSLTGRVPLWLELSKHASKRLWLGCGFSGFWTADQIEEISDIFFWHIPSGHSNYFDLVLNLGIVGLGLYLTTIFLGIGKTLAAYRQTLQPEFVFAFSVLLMSLVHGVSESTFIGVGIEAFLVYGLLASVARFSLGSFHRSVR